MWVGACMCVGFECVCVWGGGGHVGGWLGCVSVCVYCVVWVGRVGVGVRLFLNGGGGGR